MILPFVLLFWLAPSTYTGEPIRDNSFSNVRNFRIRYQQRASFNNSPPPQPKRRPRLRLLLFGAAAAPALCQPLRERSKAITAPERKNCMNLQLCGYNADNEKLCSIGGLVSSGRFRTGGIYRQGCIGFAVIRCHIEDRGSSRLCL